MVRRKADVYAVDKERRNSHLQGEVGKGESIVGVEEEVEWGDVTSQEQSRGIDQETVVLSRDKPSVTVMLTEKNGEVDATSIYFQMDEAKNQIVVTENQMVDTEKE